MEEWNEKAEEIFPDDVLQGMEPVKGSLWSRLIDYDELFRLEDEIEALTDPAEREARERLLEQIQESVKAYEIHTENYAFRQAGKVLLDRGLIAAPMQKETTAAAWDEIFDRLVSAEQKQATEYYSDQYRWHLFSFRLLPAAREDEARRKFDSMEKERLLAFSQYGEEAYALQNAQVLTSEDLDRLHDFQYTGWEDLFLFDPENRWTYALTHEPYCGPYFFQAV